MKTRLFCKLFDLQNRIIKPCTSIRRCLRTSTNSVQILNSIHYGITFKNDYCSKWTPNIVKSSDMNYPIPDGTIVENIWSRLDQWAQKVALVCGVTGREMKYSELQDISKRIATALLADLQLKPGQVLAIILPNMLEYPPLLLGAFEAGIIVTTMNPMYTADELNRQLKDSGAVAAITFPDKLSTLIESVSKLDSQEDFKIIVTPNIDGSCIEKQLPENVINYNELIQKDRPNSSALLDSLKPKSVSPEDIVLIPYSSGTVGQSKGVCLTHKNLMANNTNIRYVKHVCDATNSHQDVLPVVLPIFHVYGLAVVISTGLYSGAKLILLPKFEESTFLKSIKDYKATTLFLAPPLVIYIGNSPSVTKEHLSSVTLIISGAAPLAETDIAKCLNKLPKSLSFTQGYGLTETSPCVCAISKEMKIPNTKTVGKPVPNTQVKVTDLQTGQALGANEEGEIWVKGPQVMKGYLNNPKATAECIDNDGWFRTGDIGYYDENKFFYITDRLKELIKVKGFQVAPSEIEAVLRSHPDVLDAGVIGVPHPKDGEEPIGFIKSKINDDKMLEEKLRKFLAIKLAKYKHINKYFFIDSIPKSAAGKILRKNLKVTYLELTGNK